MNLRNTFLLITITAWLSVQYHAQQEFGLKQVAELTAEKYHGRGYVNGGQLKAAEYIKSEFKKYGVAPLGDDYFQNYEFAVNSFPSEVSLSLEGDTLETGIDYIVEATSGSAMGKYTIYPITSLDDLFDLEYKEDRSKLIALIEEPDSKNIDTIALFREFKYRCADLVPVIWLTDKKLMFTVGRTEWKYPIFNVDKNKVNLTNDVKTATLQVENDFIENFKTQNVVGIIKGKCSRKKLVFTAHYDHLGRMGKDAYFPGANDNASGTAMLLYLASYYAEHPPKHDIVFIAFSGEEAGLLGSRYYVENPIFPLEDIKVLTNLDILGTGEDGITVVNGAVFKKQFKKLVKLNTKHEYLSKVKVRGKAANSDHYFFSESGVPAIFIYTMGGVSYYHDVLDRAETLPLNEFDDLAKLLIAFYDKM